MKIKIGFADNGIIYENSRGNWLEVVQDDEMQSYHESEKICKAIGAEILYELDEMLKQANEAKEGVIININLRLTTQKTLK